MSTFYDVVGPAMSEASKEFYPTGNGLGRMLNMLQHLVFAGIKGIWNLQKSSSDSFDTYLVLAFVGETRILEINAEDELDEAEIEGFDAEQQVHTSLLPT